MSHIVAERLGRYIALVFEPVAELARRLVGSRLGVDPLSWIPPLSQEVYSMGKTRAPYPSEFRRQMVDLVRAGRDPDDLAREFEPTARAIRNWVVRAGGKTGGREEKGSAPGDTDELVRPRREVRQLRQERDILSKAAAWFALENGTLLSGSSGS